MPKEKKASENLFNELHQKVTEELLDRIKSGQASTADLKAACDWLAKNDITGFDFDGSPLDSLRKSIQIDPDLVKERTQRAVYGR